MSLDLNELRNKLVPAVRAAVAPFSPFWLRSVFSRADIAAVKHYTNEPQSRDSGSRGFTAVALFTLTLFRRRRSIHGKT